MTESPRVAAYVRVSTSSQVEKWGLEAQETALADECRRRGWKIAEEFKDAGISGETIEARPAMLRLLDGIRAGRFDVVLVVELERLTRSRNGSEWPTILDALEEGACRIALLGGQTYDPTESIEDGFTTSLLALLSAREKRKLVQRTSRGVRERVKAGKWWGSVRPFGYRVGADDHLVVDPVEAEVVRSIFADVRAGRTLSEIAERLNDAGVPTHRGGREWWPTAVRRIIGSPVYAGTVTYGKESKKPRGGPAMHVEGAHPAIIPAHEWHAVQTLVATRKRAGCPPSRWESGFILTGVLRCPTCGGRMYGGSSGTGGGTQANVRYYGHARSRLPDAPSCRKVRADAIEKAVLAEIAAALAGPDVAEAVRRQLIRERMADGTDESSQRAALEAEIAALDRKAAALYEDRVAGVLTPAQFRSWNEETVARQGALRAQVRDLEDRVLSMARHADVSALVGFLRDVPGVLATLTGRELKTLLWELLAEARPDAEAPNGVRVAYRIPLVAAALPKRATG